MRRTRARPIVPPKPAAPLAWLPLARRRDTPARSRFEYRTLRAGPPAVPHDARRSCDVFRATPMCVDYATFQVRPLALAHS
ncbi:hypothetical protein C0Z17_21960 [Trinickia caryophylli]|nr:hypothetical protein C0Z17_21960 [Trinickia caryophylli]